MLAACISDKHCDIMTIPDGSFIFTAEAKAVDLARVFIRISDYKNNIFLSDLRLVLKAKASLAIDQTHFKIPISNFKPFINKYV